MEKKNPERGEINILKAISVLGVILIHIFSFYRYGYLAPGSLERNFTLAADQVFRFCVPVFVAVSGLGLTLGYGQGLNLGEFIKRRLLKLLPWYLFWATVIILTATYVFNQAPALYDHLPLWKLYVLGKADIHLYFVVMIFQLYLLFPILLFIFKRFPRLLFLASLIWQIGWYYYIGVRTEIPSNRNTIWTDQQQYLSFVSWIFYFVLGMSLSRLLPVFNRKLLFLGGVLLAMGFVWAEINTFQLMSAGMETTVAQRFTRLPILIYASGFLIVGWYFFGLVASNLVRAGSILVWMGKRSYLVYLLHTTVTRVFFISNTAFVTRVGLIPISLISIFLSFLAAEVFSCLSQFALAKIHFLLPSREA